MTLALFAHTDDPTANHVAAAAQARGVEVEWVDFRLMRRGEAIQFEPGERPRWQAGLVRHLPSQTALLGPPAETLSHEAHWRLQLEQRERHELAVAVLLELEARGVPLANPVRQSGAFDNKAFQLATLAREGVPVPRTLVTNDASAMEAFAAQVRTVVAKPLGGGALARVLDEGMRARLAGLTRAPALFQEQVEGDNLRVTVVAHSVASAVLIPSSTLDYREDPRWLDGTVPYQEVRLSAADEAMFVHVARVCGHVLSGIDAKRTRDGKLVVLEANSAPVFLEVERQLGHPITAMLLDHLL